jgi:hypothetical protein
MPHEDWANRESSTKPASAPMPVPTTRIMPLLRLAPVVARLVTTIAKAPNFE